MYILKFEKVSNLKNISLILSKKKKLLRAIRRKRDIHPIYTHRRVYTSSPRFLLSYPWERREKEQPVARQSHGASMSSLISAERRDGRKEVKTRGLTSAILFSVPSLSLSLSLSFFLSRDQSFRIHPPACSPHLRPFSWDANATRDRSFSLSLSLLPFLTFNSA